MTLVTYEKLTPFIGMVKLNDPDNLNAMSEEMAGEFSSLIRSLNEGSSRPRVMILTGSGKAFSAGGHLKMLEKKQTLSQEENRKQMLSFYDSFLCMLELEVPIIAAINGSAVGAGMCVAAACDIRIATESAKLGFTFLKLGLHPGMAATYFVPRVAGNAAASELLLTGRIINASEAFRLGLVSRVVPTNEDLIKVAHEIASEIMDCGPHATAQLLRSLRGAPQSLSDALETEAAAQSINYPSAEFAEGLAAVREKRKPNF